MKWPVVFCSVCILLAGCKPPLQIKDVQVQWVAIQALPEDSAIASLQAYYGRKVDSLMQEVVGHTAVAMPKERSKPETLLGNFVADLVLEQARLQHPQVDFALLNIGGLRNSLPAGPVTRGDVFQLMPFDNELVLVEMKPASMAAMIDFLIDQPIMPIGGLRINVGTKEVMVGQQPWNPEKTYWVATSDFLAGGGDKMTFLTHAKPVRTGLLLRDMIISSFIQAKAEGRTLSATLDGRISQTEQP
jgi:2',3'-cyclic-nucleotide 2'-phosphodiesterase (5'-nucleotidase family)